MKIITNLENIMDQYVIGKQSVQTFQELCFRHTQSHSADQIKMGEKHSGMNASVGATTARG